MSSTPLQTPDAEHPTLHDGPGEPTSPVAKEHLRLPLHHVEPTNASLPPPTAETQAPYNPDVMSPLSPSAGDRVFPIRSVVSVDPNPTATPRPSNSHGDYFHPFSKANDAHLSGDRRGSQSSTTSQASRLSNKASDKASEGQWDTSRQARRSSTIVNQAHIQLPPPPLFQDYHSQSGDSMHSSKPSASLHIGHPPSPGVNSTKSGGSSLGDMCDLVIPRFKHIPTEGGHMIITGHDGDTLQRCEDEPIHMPGAVQGFGLLVALQEEQGESGNLIVRMVTENSKRIIGRSPRELFSLESFTDILSEEQAENLLDHIDFIKDEDSDVMTNGPEVFTLSLKVPGAARARKLWCAIHVNSKNPGLILCEFELEDDPLCPLVPPNSNTPELPEDTLSSNPTLEELLESTEIKSRPLRVLRSARKRKGEAAAMEVFNIMSQVQEQLAVAPSLDKFLKVLVGVVKELTGFHRVMIYQFDSTFNGRVVTELVDPRATKDLYKGLHFPASDIPKQARELYKLNKVRMLYDRDQETARIVCRSAEDLEVPLDLTHSYLRAMSPIHLKYLANMAVRSSMSVSINAFNELWGLIACHSYGPRGMRVSFPIRKMCRMVGDAASRNVERLSYASRLQARKLINTVPSQHNPSGYIIASSDDLLNLFNADFGLLSIRDETKVLGQLDSSQEALAMLEYLRMRKIQSVMTSMDINQDFPDLRYPPGFHSIAGTLLVPLSANGEDFIVFFRRGQMKEVKWAGNPYEKFVKEGTEGYLEPRKSFKTWSETILGKCREWTEEEIETASVLCLVYGKFIEVWRQKEAALQSSQLTRLLLANSAHEVRTPLNAIINYLEIALEGTLDNETRENLARSHSASKSLIYVINDLLDLTKTEEGGPLIKGESFDLKATIKEATDMFRNDAKRKNIDYDVVEHPGLPTHCIGDQRRVRQAISNITANAIQFTNQGSVKVEAYVAARPEVDRVEVEVAVSDTGVGINSKRLDQLFYDLEQVQSEPATMLEDALVPDPKAIAAQSEKTALGLGLAVVARIVKNMNGQLRLRSEEGKGTRFIIQFPFDTPESEVKILPDMESPTGSIDSQPQPVQGERTLIAPSLSRNPSEVEEAGHNLGRRASAESLGSKASLHSSLSGMSQKSQKSDVDRLIDAISEPHLVDNRPLNERRPPGARSLRPPNTKRNSVTSAHTSKPRSRSLDVPGERAIIPPHQRFLSSKIPGEEQILFSSQPLKAVRVPDDGAFLTETKASEGLIIGEVNSEPKQIPKEPENLTANHMRVLVAEDDPINSRIIKKRLEKLRHQVYLTINGEECASAFGDHPKDFDVVLMDMQMPIVDGLTSTKMIRSYEKLHKNIYSPRAKLCGRLPIIAVSASLIERDRQHYIDAGFDAWILKPISFDRLNKLLEAIVDTSVRKSCLYRPGQWEQGGWFHNGQKSSQEVSTKPSGEAPVMNLSKQVQEAADHPDDPMAGQENEHDPISEEQKLLLEDQEKGKIEVPDEGNNADPSSETPT